MKVLVDADIVVFRCAFAAERMVWHLQIGDKVETHKYKAEALAALDEALPGKYSRKEGEDYVLWSERELEPFSHARQNVNTLLGRIQEATGTSAFDTKMYLSPANGATFRHDLAKTRPYKGQRDQTHRPTYETEIRDYIIENWETDVADYEEADDLLAIAQTANPESTIIATMDKDLNQVPGLKYNFAQDRTFEVTPEQAIYNFHVQLMTGDTTDNIPGLPGIGPGKAMKALHGITDPAEQMAEVWRMYQIHSGVEDPWEYLKEQGQLVYIRRVPGEVWEPAIEDKEEAWDNQDLSLY